MKKKRMSINLNHLILFLLLGASIFPVINIGPYEMPILYLLIPIGLFILLFVTFNWIKTPKVAKVIISIFSLIILGILLSTFYGTIDNLNQFIFPSDILQYIARMVTIICFIAIIYKRKVNFDTVIKYMLIISIIAMLIGILQWIPWPGREFLVRLYPFRDGGLQLSQLNRNLSNLRIHGVSQHATANGGLAAFFSVFGISIYRYYDKYKLTSILLIVVSIINLFAGQSRAGILALVSALIMFYVTHNYIEQKPVKNSVRFIIMVTIILSIVYILYINGNSFINTMVYRWENLFETQGGGRVDQINYFSQFFRSIFDYIFGLSKPFVNESAISYGVEIEPVNILINYGILGFILQYSLVIYLVVYFFKSIKNNKNNKAILVLLVSSLIGLISYQVFSVGYYFFREIRVGLIPWILMGITIGALEKQKSKSATTQL